MKQLLLSLLCLSMYLSAFAYGDAGTYRDTTLSVDKRVDLLLKQMTLDEKVRQLESRYYSKFRKDSKGRGLSASLQEDLRKGVGIIQLSTGGKPEIDVQAVNDIFKYVRENNRLGIPPLMAGEALHGLIARGATSYPQAIALASTWNPELVKKVYSQIALEARARGFNIVFSPLLDLARDPRWGRMEETYGEDVFLVSEIGVAAIQGLQGGGNIIGNNNLVSAPKHFVGYGQCDGGRNFAPSVVNERMVYEDLLEPFRQAVKRTHMWGVMPSHNEINGIPCHGNKKLLTDILREDWGFQGIVVSDFYDVGRLNELHHVAIDAEHAALQALEAGVNLDQPLGTTYETLISALKEKTTYLPYLDQRVREVLRIKFMLGLFDKPLLDVEKAKKMSVLNENKMLAEQAAESAMILLKNENNLLPLDKSKYNKIAVIGPNANNTILGGYSPGGVKPKSILTAMQDYLKDSGIEVLYAHGCNITKAPSYVQLETANLKVRTIEEVPLEDELDEIAEAVKVAEASDLVVLCLGDNHDTSREAIYAKGYLGDRASLELVGNQNVLAQKIIETGKPVIVYLMHGRSLSINYIDEHATAILDGWYAGERTAQVVIKTLFGENNPGGKLVVTVPRSAAHVPAYYSQRKSGTWKGYLFEDSTPLYPFGYGLSYTNFKFSDIRLSASKIKKTDNCVVSLNVTNTGKYDGDEVVQVYVKDLVGSVTRPSMQLKGFQRVSVAQGETKRVEIVLPPTAFEMIDADNQRVIEPGEFKIFVGNSSDAKSLTELSLTIVE